MRANDPPPAPTVWMSSAGTLMGKPPIVHSVRPLRELAISLQELIDRKVFGKAVLTP